jgi:formate hydrogenlyase subunit 4
VIADLALALIQALVVAAGAPLLVGVLRTLKARLVGRRGPRPWQPYADLAKLLRKEAVVSTTTSWVFRVTPYVLFATMLVAAVIVPVVASRTALPFAGIILLMYLFLVGSFFLALAGLDSGSAFGGMGASREVAVAALAEPTVILAVFALALRADTTNLGGIVARLSGDPSLAASPGHLLAFAAFFIVMLAETGRLPVDNPATHLELTMIHEALLLEYSARHLALMEWAAALKLFNYSCIGLALFFPYGIAAAGGDWLAMLGAAPALIAKLVIGGFLLALIETLSAKMRIFRAPEFLGTAFLLAVLAMLVNQMLGS